MPQIVAAIEELLYFQWAGVPSVLTSMTLGLCIDIDILNHSNRQAKSATHHLWANACVDAAKADRL